MFKKRWGLIVALVLSVVASLGTFSSFTKDHDEIAAGINLANNGGQMNWSMVAANNSMALADTVYDFVMWLAGMSVIWGIYFAVRLLLNKQKTRASE